MKIRISPADPPLEQPFDQWVVRISAEICRITGAKDIESISGAGGPDVGDRQTIVFVVDIPQLLPSMERELCDAYSYCEGDSAVWRGFHVMQPPEPSVDE